MAVLSLMIALSIAADDKLRKAVEQAAVTGEFLQTLTYDDVPNAWKAQKKSEPTDDYTKLVFFRDGVRRLEVMWSNEWNGDKEKRFIALLYCGETMLAKIARLEESTTVFPVDAPKGYQVSTSIMDDGTATVTVTNDDSAFFESVVLKGRETCLLDDLEYTKSVIAMEGIAQPFVDLLKDALDGKP